MGDSNLVVDLPNLIESESNYCISDIEDVGIYKRFVLECKSLIGKDTVITKIESSFYFSIVKVGDGDLTSYNVLYLSKSNYTSLIIDGIKHEEIFNQILQSIDIEERRYFLCL